MATGNDRAQGKPASGFLSRGFRPFFLGAASLAAMAVPLWALVLSGAIALPGDFASPAWHVHEMIFGYTGAVLAGFSLTAVPNWTGRLPVAGRPLGALFALWLIGRAAMLAAPGIGPVAAGVIDALFPLVLAGYLMREIVAAGNMRNLPIAGLFTLFALANVFWHVAGVVGWDSDLAQRLGLAVVTVLIALVGGRITPSFTHNWLMKTGRPADMPGFGALDKAAVIVTAAAMLAWAAAPAAGWAGVLLCAGGVALAVRMARWRGWQTVSEPLVVILHIGYLWLAVSLGLLGLAALTPEVIDGASAVHGLTAGAIGTMTLAVMTRATLGHTGAELTADRATVTIYVLVTSGALLRVLAALSADGYVMLMTVSGLLWSGAFAVFLVSYGPRLLGSGAGGAVQAKAG